MFTFRAGTGKNQQHILVLNPGAETIPPDEIIYECDVSDVLVNQTPNV